MARRPVPETTVPALPTTRRPLFQIKQKLVGDFSFLEGDKDDPMESLLVEDDAGQDIMPKSMPSDGFIIPGTPPKTVARRRLSNPFVRTRTGSHASDDGKPTIIPIARQRRTMSMHTGKPKPITIVRSALKPLPALPKSPTESLGRLNEMLQETDLIQLNTPAPGAIEFPVSSPSSSTPADASPVGIVLPQPTEPWGLSGSSSDLLQTNGDESFLSSIVPPATPASIQIDGHDTDWPLPPQTPLSNVSDPFRDIPNSPSRPPSTDTKPAQPGNKADKRRSFPARSPYRPASTPTKVLGRKFSTIQHTRSFLPPDFLQPLPVAQRPDLPLVSRTSSSTERLTLQPAPRNLLQQDMDQAMSKLLDEQVFFEFLMDPPGRHRFREFLSSSGEASVLDLWIDLSSVSTLFTSLKSNAEALNDVYLNPKPSTSTSQLDDDIRRCLEGNLMKVLGLNVSFGPMQQSLQSTMYNNQFQSFVRERVLKELHARLGKHDISRFDRSGLGRSFCLTDPRLPDHPVVFVSEGFSVVTGYVPQEIVGRSCSLLQGPGSAASSIKRMQDGILSGEGCTELLINYRATGEPFYCLVSITPLTDANGNIAFFLGGQVDVTSLLTANPTMSFLLGSDSAHSAHQTSPDANNATLDDLTVSRSMALYKQRLNSSTSNVTIQSNKSNDSQSKLPETQSFPPDTGLSPSPDHLTPPVRSNNLLGRFLARTRARRSSGSGSVNSEDAEEAAQRRSPSPIPGKPALDLYSKVILLKKQKREITFVTSEMLNFLDIPQLLAESNVLHADFTNLLIAYDKNETKRLISDVKAAVKADDGISIACGFRELGKSKNGSRNDVWKSSFMHLSPLKDKEGKTAFFVAVFV